MEDKEREAPHEEIVPAEGAVESPEPPEPAGPDEVEDLRTRLAYLTAEFDNFRKRAAREREAQAAFGNERVLQAVLPFLDNLERAMGQPGASAESILDGVRMTRDTLLAELRKFGLEPLSAVGSAFDPSVHEAIGVLPGGGAPEGTVVAEARKGYLLNGRLLRSAQVMVAGPSGERPDGQGD
ncbi:MAG: nucleotide exchange factor GrpE [Thermodesulfobacteriota bacterium]